MKRKKISLLLTSLWPSFIKFVAIALMLMFYGCSVRSPVPPFDYSYPADKVSEESAILQPYTRGPASGLYGEAKEIFAQGKNDQAEMTLERALRIEPGNPAYWYYMGKIKLRKKQYAQAIQLCLKSKSLAGKNEALMRINDTLIGEAKEQSSQ